MAVIRVSHTADLYAGLIGFWRPMHISAVPPFARPIPSVCLSARPSVCLKHPDHCENGDRHSYYGEPIGNRTRTTHGTHLRLHGTTPSPNVGVGDPQSKLASADL